jgi:hypothetical protein
MVAGGAFSQEATLSQAGTHIVVVLSANSQTGSYVLSGTADGGAMNLGTFPGGTVWGTVSLGDPSTPAPGQRVLLTTSNGPRLAANTLTGPDGGYLFNGVPHGPWGAFTVEVLDANELVQARETGVVEAAGESVRKDLVIPAPPPPTGGVQLAVSVRRSDGTPIENAFINLVDLSTGESEEKGLTDPNGQLLIPDVPAGSYRVQAFNGATASFLGEESMNIDPTMYGQTVPVTIFAAD